MLKYLVPQIEVTDLPPMFGMAALGAIIAGVYGILHDQVTYSIGPEYFTKLKFQQFQYADFGLGDRVFVSCIGFLATWWVGFIIVWFLSRRLIPDQDRGTAYRGIFKGMAIVFAAGILAGAIGYAYGMTLDADTNYEKWQPVFSRLQITDPTGFLRVAYMHNASYLGGFVGFIIALLVIRPRSSTTIPTEEKE